ncbi:MAG: CopG family transcriptional regulator [Candidatus Limnocylindria bacterium]
MKTTVYLPEPLKKRLETVAHQEGISEAQLVRAAIEHYTTEHVRPRPKLPLFRTLEPIADWDEAMRGFGED